MNVLREIYEWASQDDERKIYWLCGLAGTGKSTIARTVARNLDERGLLGASFFFSRGGGDLSSAEKFFSTIAIQIAESIPESRHSIEAVVQSDPSVGTKTAAIQWQKLIVKPISDLQQTAQRNEHARSRVLVVDALDECLDEASAKTIISLLSDSRNFTGLPFRVFITSRPETPMRSGFSAISERLHHKFILHNIPLDIVDRDISVYLREGFRNIKLELMGGLGHDSRGEETIHTLVQRAGGLFIWASTALRFISQGRKFAKRRLHKILHSEAVPNTPEAHLDNLYTNILEGATQREELDIEEREELLSSSRDSLGTIITLLAPLSLEVLSRILEVTSDDLQQSFESLHSILDVPSNMSDPIRLHHPSFRDFLYDTKRCTARYHVSEVAQHRILLKRCLKILNDHLKANICEIGDVSSEPGGISKAVLSKYLPEELRYACSYWVQHLQRSNVPVSDDGEEHCFVREHLLHWFESLAWIGRFSDVVVSLQVLREISEVRKILYTVRI